MDRLACVRFGLIVGPRTSTREKAVENREGGHTRDAGRAKHCKDQTCGDDTGGYEDWGTDVRIAVL